MIRIDVGKAFSYLISTISTELALVLKELTAVLLDDYRILTYGNISTARQTSAVSVTIGRKGIVTECQRVTMFNLS